MKQREGRAEVIYIYIYVSPFFFIQVKFHLNLKFKNSKKLLDFLRVIEKEEKRFEQKQIKIKILNFFQHGIKNTERMILRFVLHIWFIVDSQIWLYVPMDDQL